MAAQAAKQQGGKAAAGKIEYDGSLVGRKVRALFVDDDGNHIKYEKDVGFASDEEDILDFVAELKTDHSEL